MERITSRKNGVVQHFRTLASDPAYRSAHKEFVCAGAKLLQEALTHGAEITAVLSDAPVSALADSCPCYLLPSDLLEYVSPLRSGGFPVFSVAMRESPLISADRILVLDGIQDPGNLGTILRTANALNMDAVVFCGACADVYGPKAVRASMGAVFRQRFYEMTPAQLRQWLSGMNMKLYGAALSPIAENLRSLDLNGCAVAVGSEGRGLSDELLSVCDGQLIIPMNAQCESLNAAVAAALIMWELSKGAGR